MDSSEIKNETHKEFYDRIAEVLEKVLGYPGGSKPFRPDFGIPVKKYLFDHEDTK